MTKKELKEIILEIVKESISQHPHAKINDKLMQIVNCHKESNQEKPYKGNPNKGNAILNKANPENIDRILRGEKPVYENIGQKFDREGLIDYLQSLDSNIRVGIPKFNPIGYSKDTIDIYNNPQEAANDLKNHAFPGEFEIYMDNPTFKKFSLILSPEQLKRQGDLVRSIGSLD